MADIGQFFWSRYTRYTVSVSRPADILVIEQSMADLQSSASVNCPICRITPAKFWFVKNNFQIWRCTECGFIFVHPSPSDTSHIYAGEDYFRGTHRGFGYIDYEADKIPLRPFSEALLERIERLMPSRGALLDVGTASGFFLKLAEVRGWETAGLEISPYAAREARRSGLDVRCGALGDNIFGRRFDAVTLLDTMEHLPDPQSAVESCRDLLRPNGLLVINTPDTSSFLARFLGKRWYSFVPPEHLSYFNAKNLSKLLIRNSFRVEEVSRIGKHFTPSFVLYMLFRWLRWPFLKRTGELVGRTPLNRLAFPINFRDNFFLIARMLPNGWQRSEM